MVEEIPMHKNVPAHQHLDFIYLAEPYRSPSPVSDDPIRYFTLDEVEKLEGDAEIFIETQETVRNLLSDEVARV